MFAKLQIFSYLAYPLPFNFVRGILFLTCRSSKVFLIQSVFLSVLISHRFHVYNAFLTYLLKNIRCSGFAVNIAEQCSERLSVSGTMTDRQS